MTSNKLLKTEDVLGANPLMEKIVSREMADIMFANNDHTVSQLKGLWLSNSLENAKKLYKKHGAFRDHFERFGTNKAVVGIGGGPSFNINKKALKELYEWNLQFPVKDQPFIFIATNKIFKSCIEIGLYPHMVMLVDAGDVLYPQLCEDIPEKARSTFLITGLHTSPRILKKWDKQGGHICFYSIGDEDDSKEIQKTIGDDVDRIHIEQGGNIMNTMWIISGSVLNSRVFMAVGNDLSFKYTKDLEARRKSFYADGDYRLSILSKRDDARDVLAWMGFHNLVQSVIEPEKFLYDMKIMGTSRLLWVYKTWMEVQVGLWAGQKPFHYYNCSETGILGVLARENSGPGMMERDNWYLMDELVPKHWHTRTLKHAAEEFIAARMILCQTIKEEQFGVRSVGALPGKTDIVRSIGL